MKPGILIFAGTTEGRSLAEYASANSVRCFVSVATDYGKSLLEKLENIILLTGRMDEKEMEHFIEENDGYSVGWIACVRSHLELNPHDRLNNVIKLLNYIRENYDLITDLNYCKGSDKLVTEFINAKKRNKK